MWVFVAAAYAGCSPELVAKGAEAVAATPDAQKVALGAMAFGAACETSYAAEVAKVGQVSPDLRGMLDLAAVANDPAPWMAVCDGAAGLRVLADLAQLAPADKRAHVWKACRLAEHGWVTEAEWLAADGLVVAPFAAGVAMKDAKPEHVEALVRALAGVYSAR